MDVKCKSSDTCYKPYEVAIFECQKQSLAELPKSKRYCLYESITESDLTNYHNISCRPITKKAEKDMEIVSDIAVSWGERYRHHWEPGTYCCSRCKNPLYTSKEKWNGPCVWPSFRQEVSGNNSISVSTVYPYNNYVATVKEVYCSKCDLFIGHQFEDGIAKGDTHPSAHWRH